MRPACPLLPHRGRGTAPLPAWSPEGSLRWLRLAFVFPLHHRGRAMVPLSPVGRGADSAAGRGGCRAKFRRPPPPLHPRIVAISVPTLTASVPAATWSFVDRAALVGFEFHRRLVGLDLGEDVAGLDGVAFLDEPFGQRPLLHGGGHGGELDFGRHLRGALHLIMSSPRRRGPMNSKVRGHGSPPARG